MRKLQYNPGFKAECPTIMQNEQLMFILSLYPFPQDLHRFCPGCKGVRGGGVEAAAVGNGGAPADAGHAGGFGFQTF